MSKTDILFHMFMVWQMFATIKSQDYIYKCVLQSGDNCICDAQNQEFNIKAEFENISATLPQSPKQLNHLEIHNSKIVEIPENVFLDISFTRIEIFDAQNLTRIHTKAFNSNTAYNLLHFLIKKPSNLSNSPPDYDIYKALSHFVKASYIEFSLGDGSHEIPENAFQDINGPQNNLKHLVFRDDNYSISRIGNQAFALLPSLTDLSFRQIPIKYISAKSFDSYYSSDNIIRINFEGCGLTDDNIENGAFANTLRPLNIDLGENALEFIREEKFGKFLRSSERNILQVHGIHLNCSHVSPYLWLLWNRTQFENRVQHAFCGNGTSIWELTTAPPGIRCQIEGIDLKCDANYQSFNITAEIEYLSQTLSEDQKKFDKLLIMRTNIEEIPENVFQDISFNFVEIFNTENLKRIHTNAFNNNTVFNLREKFYISSPNKLRNDPPDYDFWKAFSSLTYIREIDISLEKGLHEIPDNAFDRSHNNLISFVFKINNFKITRIGNNAFSELTNLSVLSFKDILIQNISAKAFDFRNDSTEKLNIYFINCNISETSLEEGVFSHAKRPLFLDLTRNVMRLIEESKFGQFFKNDIKNGIVLYGNRLDCDNLESFKWLLNQKSDLESRVLYAKCENGTHFWDLNPNATIPASTTMKPKIDPNTDSIADFRANIFLLLITFLTIYTNII